MLNNSAVENRALRQYSGGNDFHYRQFGPMKDGKPFKWLQTVKFLGFFYLVYNSFYSF